MLHSIPLVFSLFLMAADPAPLKSIRLPDAPQVNPAPPKNATITLSDDLLYVIDSDVPVFVISSPPGFLKNSEDAGPIKIKGRFADEPNKVQTKTFTGKHVITVEPAATGTAELIIIPKNAASESEFIRRMIAAKTGPMPPPVPPGPDPDPKPPTPASTFRVIFAYETGSTLTASQTGVIFGKAIEDYLKANCTPENNLPGFRRFDKDTNADNDQPTMKALWSAVKPKVTTVPCIVIERDGKAEILPLPGSVDDCLKMLRQYKEGK